MEISKKITVIGIGKLGLGFALMLENAGFHVLGVDIRQDYVDSINNKTFTSDEPFYNELLASSINLYATTSMEEGISFSNTIFILVQTPNSGGDKFYDHSILSNVLMSINNMGVVNKDIIIGCTVIPNYIDSIGKTLLTNCIGCTLSYNPEFVAQGDIIKGFETPDIILIGTTTNIVRDKLIAIYKKMTRNQPKYCVLTPREAEVTKLAINSFITTKISFANMISDLCDINLCDKHAVLDAIGSDSRIGNKYFRAGHSYGGPCFPRDTLAMQSVIKKSHINCSILKSTHEYNNEHIMFQAWQLLQENRDEYVLENVCYKENSPISLIEESAKLKIARELVNNGAYVVIHDKLSVINEVKKEYGNLFHYRIRD
jgi:nucleotide sugar dehydrogenase